MVQLRDDVPEPIKKLGKKLKGVFAPFATEDQAEAARRRFEKAVFHSQYSVDQFEAALDEHRHKMRDLGEAISDCIKQFRKHWRKADKLGEHRGKHHRAIAKTWFKRTLALEERIDAHLEKFEEKLDVLTAWRQYKIKNDVGSEVDVAEVKQFMAEELDQFELTEQSFEEQEAENMTDTIRIGQQDTISEGEQEMLNDFVEKELGDEDAEQSHDQSEDADVLFDDIGSGGSGNATNGASTDHHENESAGAGDHADSHDEPDIDEEMQAFLKD